MSLKKSKDASGSYWEVPTDKEQAAIEAWWQRKRYQRNGRLLVDEQFCIRQDNSTPENPKADVLILSPGQVYDLLHILNQAVEEW